MIAMNGSIWKYFYKCDIEMRLVIKINVTSFLADPLTIVTFDWINRFRKSVSCEYKS